MKYLSVFSLWLLAALEQVKQGFLSAAPEEEETKPQLLKLDLQFFADEDDEEEEEEEDDKSEGDDDDDDDPEDKSTKLDALLKDKAFKRQLSEYMKPQINKRLKKFEGITPEDVKKFKEEQAKKNGGANDDDREDSKAAVKIEKAEIREKRAAAKEFAIDEGIDPVLFVKFIDVKKIELDEDGEPENLDELLEELQDGKYGKYFAASDDEDDDKKKSNKKYSPGNKNKKLNKEKKVDKAALGAARAEKMYGKKKGEK